jgi:prepilin-type N-terminal cleavage/methylation domain-containing protein
MKQKGFTLIELIVAIAVLVLISSISIANFRQGERQKSLSFAADTVTNSIRNAQNLTLTSKQIDKSTCTVGVINDKAPQSYILAFLPSSPATLYGVDKCNTVHNIESYNLPPKTSFQTNGLKINGSTVPGLQIKFTPPFANMTSSNNTTANQGVFSAFTTASVTMKPSNGSELRTVTIDGVSGRIGE